MSLQKVLIVKIGAIGDVVMALPLLTYLKETAPNVHITWVAGKTVEPILQMTHLVDTILTIDEKTLFRGTLFQRMRELASIQAKLAGKYFDRILTGHVDWRYRLLSLTARSKERKSFERSKGRQFPVPGRYHGSEYMRLALGIDDETIPLPKLPALSFPPSEFKTERPLVILAPGGAKNILAEDSLRRWPIQHYADLARMLEKNEIEIAITGAYSDSWILPYFEGIRCKNFVGQLSLLDLLSLMNSSQLLITHDSGPLHLAKLTKCKAIGLFGPTNPWEKVSREENVTVMWGGERLPCRPCYDGKSYARCKKNLCLQNISPETVFQKAQNILETAKRTPLEKAFT